MKTLRCLVMALVAALFTPALSQTAVAAPDDVALGLESLSVSKADLVCLALNDYWEARGETLEGRLAVAEVVLNRVDDRRFPDSICDVVKHSRSWRLHRCQFSWYCDGQSDVPRNTSAWRRSLSLATAILQNGADRPERTNGALWYHADFVSPGWASRLAESVRVGGHIFYRDRDVRRASNEQTVALN